MARHRIGSNRYLASSSKPHYVPELKRLSSSRKPPIGRGGGEHDDNGHGFLLKNQLDPITCQFSPTRSLPPFLRLITFYSLVIPMK